MKIGVLAGTPIDTQMGVEYIISKGHTAVGIPCSKTAQEQNEMQILHKEELLEIAVNNCKDMIKQGAEGIFIYCNSLSAAINIQKLKQSISVPAITPLDIYKQCADTFDNICVLAANGQSLAGIEKVILSENPDCTVFGAGILPLVVAIESNTEPHKIYEDFKLKSLTESFEAIGCNAIILGCTHFPYIETQVKNGANVPVINPSDSMLEYLVKCSLSQ